MADGPKKISEGPKGHTLETFLADSFVLIFGFFIISALLARIAVVFGGNTRGGLLSILNIGGFIDWLVTRFYPKLEILAIIFSILFLWGIFYSFRKLTAINKEINKKYSLTGAHVSPQIAGKNINKNDFSKEWQEVLKHASSHNPNDWKIAILDADSILDEVLIGKGVQGETLGERLKSVDPADMKTLDMAWEAHKYRNAIAHGNELSFNQHEVRRIIALFEKTFKELKAI